MNAEEVGTEFVLTVARQLCDDKDSINVVSRIDENGVLLLLYVAKTDLGRMIGKQGSTANAIRSLLRALGAKNDARFSLKIEEAKA